MQIMTQFSTQQVADLFGVPIWQVQRLFECGDLAEPPRFAGKRVIAGGSLPAIVDALRGRGWLPVETHQSEIEVAM